MVPEGREEETMRVSSVFLLTAPAGAAAVEALVAGAVANHDRAAVGARRRVLLAHETDLDRARIGWCRLDRRGRRSRRGRNLDDWVAADDADVFLLGSTEELRRQPAEDVVGDRLRDRDFGVLGNPEGSKRVCANFFTSTSSGTPYCSASEMLVAKASISPEMVLPSLDITRKISPGVPSS